MGFALVGLLCGAFGLVAVLLVSGGLLRLAVGVANRIIRPTKADAVKPARRGRSGGVPEWDWDDCASRSARVEWVNGA